MFIQHHHSPWNNGLLAVAVLHEERAAIRAAYGVYTEQLAQQCGQLTTSTCCYVPGPETLVLQQLLTVGATLLFPDDGPSFNSHQLLTGWHAALRLCTSRVGGSCRFG